MRKYFCYFAAVLMVGRLLIAALIAYSGLIVQTPSDLYSPVLCMFLLGLVADALSGLFTRMWECPEEDERTLFWWKKLKSLDVMANGTLLYAVFVLITRIPECRWATLASLLIGVCCLCINQIRSKNIKVALETAYMHFYTAQVATIILALTILDEWPTYVYVFYGIAAIARPWSKFDLTKGVKRMMTMAIVFMAIVVAVTLHQFVGRPIELQSIDYGDDNQGEILYVCIPGTAPCNAYPFNAIRDRVLLSTGDVLYVKYPEKWFSFRKSTIRMAEIIEHYSTVYEEIRIIAGSLGAKIAVGAEAQMEITTDCKITNYLISPSFGPYDVRWVEMFRSGFGSNRKVELDPEMDILSQTLVDKDVKEHTLMHVSQLLESLSSVDSKISSEIYSVIIASEGDWLTNTDKAAAKFEKKISTNFEVVSLPLKTHCEYLREAHIYCGYFEEMFSS
ncbi:MAG: hypothetical protein ACK5MU_02185 [Candidatus Saccharimonadales bacterium]